jgi:hypothetical protein
VQVEVSAHDEQVFVRFFIFRFRGGLVGHEAEPAVHGKLGVDRRQAALADQRDGGFGLEVHPGHGLAVRAGALLATGVPTDHRVGRRASQLGDQAHVSQDRIGGFQGGGSGRKGGHVEPFGGKFSLHPHQSSAPGASPAWTAWAMHEGAAGVLGASRTIVSMQRTVILASTSRYRRELLTRLKLPFDVQSPEVDETPLPGETPHDLAVRLALEKANAVAARFPEAVVIGSDQVADLDGEALGKPGDHANAPPPSCAACAARR